MLLKILVMLALSFAPLVLPGSASSQEQRDHYLELIRENGEVIGCSTEGSFQMLLDGSELSQIAEFCRPHELAGDPVFMGWWFFSEPDYDAEKPDDTFVVARKYRMDAPEGTIRFVWPYPLDPSDYAQFTGPFMEEPTAEELAEYAGNEDGSDEPPQVVRVEQRNPHATYL